MQPYTAIWFRGLANDPSIEAAVHRWVARLEETHLEIYKAEVAIERTGKHRVVASVTLELDGGREIAVAQNSNVYVAVADAFRAARKQWLAAASDRRTSTLGGPRGVVPAPTRIAA